MKTLTLKRQGELCYAISPTEKPRLTLKPGEDVVIETEDAFSGQIRRRGDRRDTKSIPYPNPLTGPVYVRGAKPGGTLAVRILKITPLIGQGATRFLPWWWFQTQPSTTAMNRLLNPHMPHGIRICKISNGRIHYSPGLWLPYSPMIGTIGTARRLEVMLANDPGPHGGNLDQPEITDGSTVYLPIEVPGALLYLGDAHAIQGDGELSGTGMEMPARVKLSVKVLSKKRIYWPRIETRDRLISVAATGPGRSLQDAIHIAFSELIHWLRSEYRMEKWDAYRLCGLVGGLRIGNLWSVGAYFPKKYLR